MTITKLWCDRCITFLAMIMFASVAYGDGSIPAGVWKGSLGKQKITVCINDGAASGNYYYDEYLEPIVLTVSDDGLEWHEDHGYWKLSSVDENNLKGHWFKSKGGKPLPIAISRVTVDAKDVENGGYCGANAYNDKIEPAPTIDSGADQIADGIHYRTLSVSASAVNGGNGEGLEADTIEVTGSSPAIKAINNTLRKRVPQTLASMKDSLYACRRAQMAATGGTGDDRAQVGNVVAVKSRWLSVETSIANFCASAHYTYQDRWETWDIQTGHRVNFLSWFANGDAGADSEDDADDAIQLPGELDDYVGRLVRKGMGDNCTENGAHYYVHMDKAALIFTLQGMENGSCTDDFPVPYQKLKRFLSPAGKAELKAILAKDG